MYFIFLQVIITTYKVATVLEVSIDGQLRNKRKEKALEAINNLLNKPDTDHEDTHHSHEKHSKSAHHKNKESKEEKHESKHRKKKHKRK